MISDSPTILTAMPRLMQPLINATLFLLGSNEKGLPILPSEFPEDASSAEYLPFVEILADYFIKTNVLIERVLIFHRWG